MQDQPNRMRKRRLRMRSGNHLQCLLCYLIAFSVPLLWQYGMLRMVYPWKLAATAPDVAAHLLAAFPFLDGRLAPIAAATAENASALRAVLAAREQVWHFALAVCAASAWLATLIVQLIWRFANRSPLMNARATARAIRSYRLTMLIIWLLNAAVAACVWLFGVQFIPGRTLWDHVVSFSVFLLIPLSAAIVSRLAASPAISGKHAFFKRI